SNAVHALSSTSDGNRARGEFRFGQGQTASAGHCWRCVHQPIEATTRRMIVGWSINRPTGLTFHRPGLSTKGYTLLTPHGDTCCYLIDIAGCVVHRWKFSHILPGYGRLLDNGNLLMTGSDVTLPEPPPDEPTKPPPPFERHVTRLGGYH